MELIDRVKDNILEIIEDNECYLDDIIFEQSNNEWYLRIFIDKLKGSLDIDTCVAVSEKVSERLDEIDIIKQEYYLEVSSPGAEKELKTLEIIANNIDSYVHVKLKNPKAGLDQFEGYITGVEGNDISFQYLVKNIKKKITINYEDVKKIRLAVKF